MTARRARACFLALLTLTAPAVLAGCADDEPAPPTSFAPLSFSYLRPLRLNVGSVEINDAWTPDPASRDISAQSPAIPLDALRQMAQDRLVASGASGRAVFTVEQASIVPVNGTLDGLLKVRLDLYTSAGQRAAFAEAAVSRSATAPDSDNPAVTRAALYTLTRQMMSDMNVEFEFQLRRSLGDWLQAGNGPAPLPAAVQQQALPPPTPASPTGYRLVPSPPPGSTAPPS
jgi:hypothetical protein